MLIKTQEILYQILKKLGFGILSHLPVMAHRWCFPSIREALSGLDWWRPTAACFGSSFFFITEQAGAGCQTPTMLTTATTEPDEEIEHERD